MPIAERIGAASDVRAWTDSIPLHYEYTAGVAGEAFLRGLADGKILAGYCPHCDTLALPARMYCVDCFSRTTKLVRAGPVGVVKAISRSVAPDGEKVSFGFIEFPGVKGGIVHRLLPGVRAGSRVRASFKPKRQRVGAMSDVVGFGPAG